MENSVEVQAMTRHIFCICYKVPVRPDPVCWLVVEMVLGQVSMWVQDMVLGQVSMWEQGTV